MTFFITSNILSGSPGSVLAAVPRQCNSSQPQSLQSFQIVQWKGSWGKCSRKLVLLTLLPTVFLCFSWLIFFFFSQKANFCIPTHLLICLLNFFCHYIVVLMSDLMFAFASFQDILKILLKKRFFSKSTPALPPTFQQFCYSLSCFCIHTER